MTLIHFLWSISQNMQIGHMFYITEIYKHVSNLSCCMMTSDILWLKRIKHYEISSVFMSVCLCVCKYELLLFSKLEGTIFGTGTSFWAHNIPVANSLMLLNRGKVI